ncbi:MAG: PAS domain-containing protein [Ignavibacteriaceae bacterium]
MDNIIYLYIAAFLVIAVFNFFITGKSLKASKLASWILLVSLFAGGLAAINWQGELIDAKMRFNLLRQTNALAQSVNPSHVKALTFSEKDFKKPAFIRMRDQLITYSRALGLQSIYTMKLLSDGSVLFGPESLPSDDPDASPPGTLYESPSKELYESFKSGVPFTEGPLSDEYGTFVTAMSPVFDPASDEVMIMLGVDIRADIWESEINYHRKITAGVVIFIILVLLGVVFLIDAKTRNLLIRFSWAKYSEAFVVAIIGLLVTAIVAIFFYQKENEDRDRVFAEVAEQEVINISGNFKGIRDYGFKMLVNYFSTSDNVTQREFESMVSSVVGANASRVMMGWAPALSENQKLLVENLLTKDNRESNAEWDRLVFKRENPASLEKIKYPLMFLEPVGDMGYLLGIDLASDPYFMKAIQKGIETGQTNEVDPSVKYVSGKNLQRIIAFKPVYSDKSEIKELLGFAIGILHTEKFLRSDLYSAKARKSLTEMDLYQTYTTNDERYITSTFILPNDATAKTIRKFSLTSFGQLSFNYPLFVFGNTYMLVAKASKKFEDSYRTNYVLFIVLAGFMITGLLVLLVTFVNKRNVDLERIVEARTSELKASESELRWLFKSMSSAFVLFKTIYDERGEFSTYSFAYVNDAFEKIVGFKFEEIAGKTSREIFPKSDVNWCERFREVALSGASQEFDMYHEGMNKILHVNAYRPWDSSDRFCVIFDDITEKKKAQDEIIRYSKRLDLPMQVGSMAWWEMNVKTGSVIFDKRKTDMLGYEEQSFLHYKDFMNIVHPDDYEKTMNDMKAHLSGLRNKYETEYRIKTKSGKYKWFYDIGAIESRDETGAPVLITGVVMDISARKEIEHQIKDKNEQLQQANNEKDKFFSIISHDLRGPLGSFMSLSALIAEDIDDFSQEEIKKMAEDLKDSSANIYDLLENLLKWSKMRLNKIVFAPESFNLLDLVKTNTNALLHISKLKDIEFVLDIPPDLEIKADKDMIGTVIRNFVSNSLKYTRKNGKVNVVAKKLGNGAVEIAVIDNGIGMSRKITDNLFRLDVDTNRKGTEGEASTGLGLLLCKEFVEQHGSKIVIESRENEGSKFSFVL